MLPLKDNIPSQHFPILTTGLIAVNVLAFFYEIQLGPRLGEALVLWGLVPVRYTVPEVAAHFNPLEQVVPFLSSMFLHGGWTHLIGNMWTLWIFGDNVEDRLGFRRFLLLYLLGGVAAALLHVFTNTGSEAPTIGASGAVAAVMGAYFRLYPHARIAMIVPPLFFGPIFVVPAVVFLGWWFILQFFNGTLSLVTGPEKAGGIAWWAHIGGFVFGALLCSVLQIHKLRRPQRVEDEEEDGA
jgi:hypothetical protein